MPSHFARAATVFGLIAGSLAAVSPVALASSEVTAQTAGVPQIAPHTDPLAPLGGVTAAAGALASPSLDSSSLGASHPETATRQATQRKVEARRAATEKRKLKVRTVRAKVVSFARKQIGDTYTAGGNGPNNFDCSGLTQFVFRVAANKELPHQSRAQYGKVSRIPKSKAQPGDLVFFFERGAHHVGIYIGKGKMIDAVDEGRGVRVSPISGSWWSRSYSGMGRVLPAA